MTKKLCGRTPGIPLSAEGRGQAMELSKALSGRKLSAVYSSPLERALATAKCIAEPHGIAPEIDERFNELDFGNWTGMSFEELEPLPLWQEYNRARSNTSPPRGEEPLAARGRAYSAIYERAATQSAGEIAIVTHADIIRSVLTSFLDMSLDHLLRFEMAPASVTELSIRDASIVLHSINRTLEQRF